MAKNVVFIRGSSGNDADVDSNGNLKVALSAPLTSVNITIDEFPAPTAMADGDANPTTTRVGANGLIFDGTLWNRERDIIGAQGGSGGGILAAAMMGFGGSTYQRLMTAAGIGDANSLLNALAIGLWGYNGSTWDRARLDSNKRLLVSDALAAPTGPINTRKVTASGVTEVIAAPASGSSIVVTDLLLSNAGSGGVEVDLREGGSNKISMYLAALGGGYVSNFKQPWILPAATALNANLGAAATNSGILINIQYYVRAGSS